MHYYTDTSKLNAPYATMPSGWDVGTPSMERMMRNAEAPAPVSGLGIDWGWDRIDWERMRQNIDSATQPLKPITVGVPDWVAAGRTPARGIVDQAARETGGLTSDAIRVFQTQMNGLLKKKGCSGIGADGRIGPQTCGAARYLAKDPTAAGVVSQLVYACDMAKKTSGYTCQASGGGIATPALPTEPPALPEESGMMSSIAEYKWYLIGGGAIVAALAYRAYKKRQKGR